jgi:nitrite reductase (NADH) small subunit
VIRACSVEDVPCGEGRAVTVEGKRIALFRAAGGWFALDAVCPHKGGPLEDGIGCDAVRSYAVSVRGDGVHVQL